MSAPRLPSLLPRSPARRRGTSACRFGLGAGLALIIGLTGGWWSPALGGQGGGGGTAGHIVVVDIDGLLDPVTADLIRRSVAEGERDGATLVILAIDSSVAVDVDVDALAATVEKARVPVVAWVKGGGAAAGGSAVVAHAADITAKAGNASLEGRADLEAPTLRDLIALLDGRQVEVNGETRSLRLGVGSGAPGSDGEPDDRGSDEGERQVLPIQFRELGLVDQAQHALTSPFVAYLLLMLGACLIVFEFFAIGIGIAAAVGALLLLGAFVGFAHLPVDEWSLALIVAGLLAMAIDVQAGASRFWAVVGAAMVVVGSLRLYNGPAAVDPPVWQVLLVVAGALLFVLPGLAAVIRARFSTPTIGRDWMVGETGTAAVEFDQDGVVTVRGAPWRARSTRAAAIAPGQQVRVTAIRGLVLEVEPWEDPSEARSPAPG